jgi:hypothetical protein
MSVFDQPIGLPVTIHVHGQTAKLSYADLCNGAHGPDLRDD